MKSLQIALSLLLVGNSVTPVCAEDYSELFLPYKRSPIKTDSSDPLATKSDTTKDSVNRAAYTEFGQSLTSPTYTESEGQQRQAEALYAFMSYPALINVRGGGSSGKRLGVYRDGKNIEFKSKEYAELDPHVKAHWAIFFYAGVFSLFHGGWQATMDNRYADPISATYVPWDKVESLPTFFFSISDEYHDPGFKFHHLGGFPREEFKLDAILDAVNLIGTISHEANKTDAEKKAIDAWISATVDRYQRHVGEEGHNEAPNPHWTPPQYHSEPHPMHIENPPKRNNPFVPSAESPHPSHLQPKSPWSEPTGSIWPADGNGQKHLDELLKKMGQ